eukprot:9072622-Prorocentrum_lima.AAC.1
MWLWLRGADSSCQAIVEGYVEEGTQDEYVLALARRMILGNQMFVLHECEDGALQMGQDRLCN